MVRFDYSFLTAWICGIIYDKFKKIHQNIKSLKI